MLTLDRNGLMQPKCSQLYFTQDKQSPDINFNIMKLLKSDIPNWLTDLFNLWCVSVNFQGQSNNFNSQERPNTSEF